MSRMLLVEDDQFGREALRELFEENGWDVVDAANGLEAMRHMKEVAFDVIVTDVFMPEMDGVELIRQIRLTDKSQKILAISGGGAGMGSDSAVDIIEAIGADAAVQKPVSNDELLLAVDRLTAS
ncbi:MAG: CheY-like chemotaxis protein [Paracoccaceae bacterium]|jgi:CheY-like chemotaxis protein